MTILRITDHVERRIARLATMYRNSASHKGVLTALTNQVQALEDAVFGLLVVRSLNDASGVQLDNLAALLNVEREGRDDGTLRIRLRAQILANNRSGEAPVLLLILRLLAPVGAAVSLTEFFPAAVVARASTLPLPDASEVAAVLRLAKAAGVQLQLIYQDTAEANLLKLDDTAQASTGPGLGNSSNPSTGGKLAGVY